MGKRVIKRGGLPRGGINNSESGSIAILALWGVALIFILIAPVAFATRGELQIARASASSCRAIASAIARCFADGLPGSIWRLWNA